MNLRYNHITCKKISGSVVLEHPIENDFFLPEGLPDMDTVLQCETSAGLLDKNIQNGKLRLEGLVLFEVIYRDAEGLCHGARGKMPFSKTVELKDEQQIPHVELSVSYMNYRMINERRVDIRGALSIKIKYSQMEQETFLDNTEEAHLCIQQENFSVLEPMCSLRKRLTIREDMDLSGTAATMDEVITADAYVDVQDVKVIANKVVVKGTLHTDSLLTNREGSGVGVQHSIPFSQIVDAPDIEENDTCCCIVKCDDFSVEPDEGTSGKILSITANLVVQAEVYREKEISAVTDAYSVRSQLQEKRRKMEYYTASRWLNERIEEKCSVKIPEAVSAVLHVKCVLDEVQTVQAEEGLVCRIQYHTTVYYLNEESLVSAVSATAQADRPIADGTHTFGDLFVNVFGVSYVLDASGVSVQASFIISGNTLEKKTRTFLTDLREEKPLTPRKNSSLLLAFAKKGTPLWDIGKKYHVSATKIMEENDCKNSVLEKDRSLLIPMERIVQYEKSEEEKA